MKDKSKYLDSVNELLSNIDKVAVGGLIEAENGNKCYVFIFDNDLSEDADNNTEMIKTVLEHIKEHLTTLTTI